MQDRAFYERIGAKFQSERERQKIIQRAYGGADQHFLQIPV